MRDKFDKIFELQNTLENLKCELDDHVGKVAFEYVNCKVELYHSKPTSAGNFNSEWVVNNNTVTCPWSDSWRYGGHDEGEITVPIEYFYDDELFSQYKKQCADNKKRANKNRETKELEEQRKLFEHLREKFEPKI